MVTFEQVITHFKTRKVHEKNNFISNVHKAIDMYRIVDENYESLDITLLYQNIGVYYLKMKENNNSPVTIRNYMRCIEQTFDEPIIKDNVSQAVIANVKVIVTNLLKTADKEAHSHQKEKKKNNVTPSISNDTEEDKDIDINDIIPLKKQSDDFEIHDLRKEIEYLIKENTWLNKELDWFKNFVFSE